MEKKKQEKRILEERQREEALLRMRMLTDKYDLNPNLCEYLKEGRVYYSYIVSRMMGSVDTINYNQAYANTVKEFEQEWGCYVYHAIESLTPYGTMLSLLFVSQDPENWPAERPMDNWIFAHVHNYGNSGEEEFGEMGAIFLSSDCGALFRIDL